MIRKEIKLDVNTAFDSVENILRSEGVDIYEMEKPKYIKATHGSKSADSGKDLQKNLLINFIPSNNGSTIRIDSSLPKESKTNEILLVIFLCVIAFGIGFSGLDIIYLIIIAFTILVVVSGIVYKRWKKQHFEDFAKDILKGLE